MFNTHTALRKTLLASVLAGVACMAAPIAGAQSSYPNQPIKLIVPYPPGGATDVIGRIIGKALSDELKVQVVVDNRSGASGSIGASEVARSKPDGNTLLLGALTSHSIYQNLYAKNVSYNLNTDFQPVSIVGKVPLVFVVHPSVKASSLPELIEIAKQQPEHYSIASAGIGSPQHMAAELFSMTGNVKLTSVPYRGSGPAMTDVVGGQVDAMIETVPAAQAFIKSDKLRALAVTSAERAPTLPDVPTAKEAGLDDFEVSSMFGLLAPAGLDDEKLNILTQAVQKALSDKSVQDALLNQGVVTGYQDPQQAKQSLSDEIEKWRKVIDTAGIEPEQ